MIYNLRAAHCNRQFDDDNASQLEPAPAPRWLLLLGINLFNYIDRYVLAAVEPEIRATFFAAGRSERDGRRPALLGTAFLVTYMLAAPVLGWLADRFSRWLIVGMCGHSLEFRERRLRSRGDFRDLCSSRASLSASAKAATAPPRPPFWPIFFRSQMRGRILAIFCAAIPVGSALGYVLGGMISSHLGWRWAFYLVTPPGLLARPALLHPTRPARPRSSSATKQRARDLERLSHAAANALLRDQLFRANRDDFCPRRTRLLDCRRICVFAINRPSATAIFGGITVAGRVALDAARRSRRGPPAKTLSWRLFLRLRRSGC